MVKRYTVPQQEVDEALTNPVPDTVTITRNDDFEFEVDQETADLYRLTDGDETDEEAIKKNRNLLVNFGPNKGKTIAEIYKLDNGRGNNGRGNN